MKIVQALTAIAVSTLIFLAPGFAYATCPGPDPCVEETSEDWFDFTMENRTETGVGVEADDSIVDANSGGGGGMSLDTDKRIVGDIWGFGRVGLNGHSQDNEGNGSVALGGGFVDLSGSYQAHQHDDTCGHVATGAVQLDGALNTGAVSAGDETKATVAGGIDASYGQPVGGPTHARIKEWGTAEAAALSRGENGEPAIAGTATIVEMSGSLDAETYTLGPRDDGS